MFPVSVNSLVTLSNVKLPIPPKSPSSLNWTCVFAPPGDPGIVTVATDVVQVRLPSPSVCNTAPLTPPVNLILPGLPNCNFTLAPGPNKVPVQFFHTLAVVVPPSATRISPVAKELTSNPLSAPNCDIGAEAINVVSLNWCISDTSVIISV